MTTNLSTATATQTAPRFELQPYKSLDNAELQRRIQAVRSELGPKLLILGHHYQQDEVIALADLTGDSYQLSQMAAASSDCRYIAFCGVHFMAETADILANRPEKLAEREGVRVPVILPDMAAGCSMADMAAIDQIEDAWDQLSEVLDTDDITPVTYINSAASLKAFVGRHGGIVCTSSNAEAALRWSFARTSRVMFFPDGNIALRTYDQTQEDEANWLAGCLLLPRDALMHIKAHRIAEELAARTYQVSVQLLKYRLNVTGVTAQFRRARAGQGR